MPCIFSQVPYVDWKIYTHRKYENRCRRTLQLGIWKAEAERLEFKGRLDYTVSLRTAWTMRDSVQINKYIK